MIPVTVDGQTVRLELRVYRPLGVGPAPTLVFNHGSTGRGVDPRRYSRSIDFPALAQFFVQRGWVVVMPARRGRGGSEGEYDEGFETIRALGYACDPHLAIPGADRALRHRSRDGRDPHHALRGSGPRRDRRAIARRYSQRGVCRPAPRASSGRDQLRRRVVREPLRHRCQPDPVHTGRPLPGGDSLALR
jgi:hypothetical protein